MVSRVQHIASELGGHTEGKIPGSKTEHWLTVGHGYNVLEIYFPPEGLVFRLLPDDKYTPGLFSGELF